MNTTRLSRSPRRLRRQQGYVLPLVIGLIILCMIIMPGIMTLGSSHRMVAFNQVNEEAALDVAEGGLERSAQYILAHIGFLPGTTTCTGAVGQGIYSCVITQLNRTTYSMTSTGTINSKTAKINLLRIYQPNYAQFSFWAHQNGAIYFIEGDVFDGHVHTDDSMYFSSAGGGPIFHAQCDSLASNYVGSISGIEFDMGFQLNCYQGTMADVDFNSSSAGSLLSLAGSQNGLVLTGNTTIAFNGTTVKITNSRQGWTNHVYTPAAEGLIYIKTATTGTSSTMAGRAYLTGGTLDGRLTIATEEDIYIQGNMSYAVNPQTNPASNDALGLIASGDVLVDTSAPNNLSIYAAIMATGDNTSCPGSFSVINYDSGSPRGTLNLYGGIIQEIRGAVGTFSTYSGSLQTGFSKSYSYDARFINTPPPYYPSIAGKLQYSNWRQIH